MRPEALARVQADILLNLRCGHSANGRPLLTSHWQALRMEASPNSLRTVSLLCS